MCVRQAQNVQLQQDLTQAQNNDGTNYTEIEIWKGRLSEAQRTHKEQLAETEAQSRKRENELQV